MSKAMFLGITKIARIPSPNLSDYVQADGEARIIDSLGTDVTVCFYEFSGDGAALALPLGVKDGGDFECRLDDDHEDGEYYVGTRTAADGSVTEYMLTVDDYSAVEEWIASAIDRIDRDASLAAEDAWNAVWVDAAAEAEMRSA